MWQEMKYQQAVSKIISRLYESSLGTPGSAWSPLIGQFVFGYFNVFETLGHLYTKIQRQSSSLKVGTVIL